MKNIKERADEIAANFAVFDDWLDKYNYIIEIGKLLPAFEDTKKTPSNLISGCQSQVWISAEYRNGQIFFEGDSDALITKGIASILIQVLSGATPDDVINCDMNFLDNIGLREHLSPTRANGLNGMIKQMKLYAVAYKAKHETIK
ncbi:MAG: Fe-S metabolism protein SufE [Bacteroidetes bacterium HGW-Bacteroidetes-6]|jgi:cysteine desulfuration protein SufE|nr:MAG: Fe-S metabolism protein SufE [Bacteroidetes bacterium HGW-Bacteroidetes-6]